MSQIIQSCKPRLRLRGLPHGTTLGEVYQFFSSYTLLKDTRLESPVDFITHSDGKFTGQAFIYFEEMEEAKRAQRALHRSFLKERYIEMYVDHREPP